MSVRRLAEEAVQPAGFAFSEENAAWAEATIKKYPEARQQSAVIPLLMRAQDQDGWVTKAAIEHVAEMLDMPLIRVLEVATFYTQFQLNPVGTRAHVQVCGTTPCMLRGAEDLKAVCRSKIHAEQFHRNEAGTLSWEEVECLGACVNAPMVMIFEDTYEDLTPERLEEIIDLFEAGRRAEVEPGPQNGRHLSAPIGGLTSLTEDYDDLIAKQKQESGHGPANGSAPQGEGAGQSVSAPPSEAGRPDTESEQTDPTLPTPGAGTDAKVDESVEDRESDELTAKGHEPGAGQEGGTRQGSTDAEEGNVPDDVDLKTGGKVRRAEAAAEDAVIPADKQLDDGAGGQPPRLREGESAGDVLGGSSGLTEGERTETSDVMPGPVHADHFESAAEANKPESRPGDKPADLLEGPQGKPNELQQIRGIGPVIESKLNELGVYHFWQIAQWRETELIWIDDYLNFRGRAVREGWIEQAKDLQSGSGSRSGEGEGEA